MLTSLPACLSITTHVYTSVWHATEHLLSTGSSMLANNTHW